MDEIYNEHCDEHCLIREKTDQLHREIYGNGKDSLTSRMTSVENKVSLNNKFTYAIFLTLVMQIVAELLK